MPTDSDRISVYCDADRELHIDVYRLMCRRMHQAGKSPAQVQAMFGEPAQHARLVRAATMAVFGTERPIHLLGRAELVGLHEHMRREVEAGERNGGAATSWYPADWRVSLRRTAPVLGVIAGGKA